ncbi:sigma-54 interaction domain-containing protein [Thermodesulfobacteriota bacterium]
MKFKRYSISLYIIIPVIFAGIAVLALILSYNLTLYYQKASHGNGWGLLFWSILLVLFSSVSGIMIVKFIIDPMERFVENTVSLGVLNPETADGEGNIKKDEMTRYTRAFDQVTEFLTRVEARELFPSIVGQSRAMRAVFYQIVKVAPTDSIVLIQGQTGTGKEVIAESIHEHSKRKGKRFVAINCAAIPEGLLESELFGHEKGAFTGASSRKPGKFEAANGGTIFLDEIGDMPLSIQSKLLRVLEDSEVERVGGVEPVKVDVRFIAATNRDLSSMVEAGQFREDLFFRLNVFTIRLPRLAERREDIPLLAERFLKQAVKDRTINISSEAMHLLTAYDWPGNVRELRNAVESAGVMAQDVIEPGHLPPAVREQWSKDAEEERPRLQLDQDRGLGERIVEFEKGMIIEALLQANGVQVKAARLLGISERSLWHRVKKFELNPSQFKR